jgi:hypothetical protein
MNDRSAVARRDAHQDPLWADRMLPSRHSAAVVIDGAAQSGCVPPEILWTDPMLPAHGAD